MCGKLKPEGQIRVAEIFGCGRLYLPPVVDVIVNRCLEALLAPK